MFGSDSLLESPVTPAITDAASFIVKAGLCRRTHPLIEHKSSALHMSESRGLIP